MLKQVSLKEFELFNQQNSLSSYQNECTMSIDRFGNIMAACDYGDSQFWITSDVLSKEHLMSEIAGAANSYCRNNGGRQPNVIFVPFHWQNKLRNDVGQNLTSFGWNDKPLFISYVAISDPIADDTDALPSRN